MKSDRMYDPVLERNLGWQDKDGNWHKFHGHKAVIGVRDGKFPVPYHAARETYTIIEPREYLSCIDEMLDKAGLLTDMEVFDATSRLGAFRHRLYRSRRIRENVGVGDVVAFQLGTALSFDGSSAHTVDWGTCRLVCFNGAVAVDGVAAIRRRHTKSLTIDSVVAPIDGWIEQFGGLIKRYRKWREIGLDNARQLEFVAKFFEFDMTNQIQKVKAFDTMLVHQVQAQQENVEQTLWASYNGLTNWATHPRLHQNRVSYEEGRNIAHIQAQRNERVRKFVNSPYFRALEGVS